MQSPSPQKLNLPQVVQRKKHNKHSPASTDSYSALSTADAPSTTPTSAVPMGTENTNIETSVIVEDEVKEVIETPKSKREKKTVRITDPEKDDDKRFDKSNSKHPIRAIYTTRPKEVASAATVSDEVEASHTSSTTWTLLLFLSLIYITYLSCAFFGDTWLLRIYNNLANDPPFKAPEHTSPLIFNTSIIAPIDNSLTASSTLIWHVGGTVLSENYQREASLVVDVSIDGLPITIPGGNTFTLLIDEQIELSMDFSDFGVVASAAHKIEVCSKLDVNGQTYTSTAEATFYLLPPAHEELPATVEKEVAYHAGGLIAPKTLAITSLSAAAEGHVLMSLSILARYLNEASNHQVLLQVNDRSFDITANAQEASPTDGGAALLDITIDKSLLTDHNLVTVTLTENYSPAFEGTTSSGTIVAVDSKAFHFELQ